MNIPDLLAKERADYLECLMESLLERRKAFPSAVAEVLLEMGSGAKSPPYCFYRPDILCGGKDDPKMVDVNKSKYYAFEAYEFLINNEIRGRLFPFYWNALEFRLFGEIESWSVLEKWTHYWLDVDDDRYVEGKEFSNVIHNITIPQLVDDHWYFSVDMGSADPDAFFELVSLFPAMGGRKFEVGSFSMIDDV